MSIPSHQHTANNAAPTGGFSRGPVVPYVPALDGMRALAVLAVIVYHANNQWLGGGFLGVEVFFVISGYLITLLLIAERERTGTVSLGNFWIRRARRLLPALFLLLLGLIVYCAVFDRDRLGMLRGDVLSGFFYVANWFQVWTGSSYTSEFAFAPLRHLWSLAVEEQYYIVWPAIMFVLLRRLRPRTLPALGLVFTAIAIAIGLATAVIYRSGPIGDIETTPNQFMSLFGRDVLRTDFLYLGTVTRASGLLLGAALATMWRPWAIRRSRMASNANGLDAVGIIAIAALVYMHWKFRTVVSVTDGGTQGYDLLYRGGLIAVGVATVALIATVTHPRSRLGKYVIGLPFLVWVGKRSYGLYLYHWVVFQVYRKSAGVGLQPREFIALMAVTVVITEASYQFLETPIRTGRARAMWRNWRAQGGRVRGPLAVTMATLAVVPVFSVVSMVGARVIPDEITASFTDNEGAVTSISSTTTPSTDSTQPAVTTTTVAKEKIDVLAVGDSVMLGSAQRLSDAGLTVDAAKNRQVLEALQIFNYYKSTGELGNNVVIHLGTNGKTTPGTFAQIMTPLAGVARVVVLTVHVPNREYQDINNAIINDLPLKYPNVTVLDWYALANLNRAWLSSDGVHLKTEGREEYIKFILQALGR